MSINTGIRSLGLALMAGLALFVGSCGSLGPSCGDLVTPWNTSVDLPIVGSSLVLNVKDFGAVGDGNVDDTIAFNKGLAKLDSSNGGTLLVPSGTYLVGDLRIASGTALRGMGMPLPVLV